MSNAHVWTVLGWIIPALVITMLGVIGWLGRSYLSEIKAKVDKHDANDMAVQTALAAVTTTVQSMDTRLGEMDHRFEKRMDRWEDRWDQHMDQHAQQIKQP